MSDTQSVAEVSRLDLLASLIKYAKSANPQSLMIRLKIKDGADHWHIVLNDKEDQGATFNVAASKILRSAEDLSDVAIDPELVDLFDRLIDATRKIEDEIKWLILIMVAKDDAEAWRIVVGKELGRAPTFLKAARAALAGEHSHLLRVA